MRQLLSAVGYSLAGIAIYLLVAIAPDVCEQLRYELTLRMLVMGVFGCLVGLTAGIALAASTVSDDATVSSFFLKGED